VHPNNKLTINAIEAAPLEDFSSEVCTCTALNAQVNMKLIMISFQAVRANLQEAQKVLSGNGSEEDKAEARIEADVYESLQHALTTK
jgi:F-type H+-transporting ATPase subunit delta